jgi:hypothetical protein
LRGWRIAIKPGPICAGDALILLRLQGGRIVGCRAASNSPSAGHSSTGDLNPNIKLVATFVPQPPSNGGTRSEVYLLFRAVDS